MICIIILFSLVPHFGSTQNCHHDINRLDRRIKEYKKEHEEAATDISAYVSNPINAYLLTKRLTSDWKIIEQAMTNDIGTGSYNFHCSTQTTCWLFFFFCYSLANMLKFQQLIRIFRSNGYVAICANYT